MNVYLVFEDSGLGREEIISIHHKKEDAIAEVERLTSAEQDPQDRQYEYHWIEWDTVTQRHSY